MILTSWLLPREVKTDVFSADSSMNWRNLPCFFIHEVTRMYAFGPQAMPQSMGESFCLQLRFPSESQEVQLMSMLLGHMSPCSVCSCSTPTGNCTWFWTMGHWRSPETHTRCVTLYLCFLKVLAMIRKVAQTKWQKMFLPHPHPPIQGISYLVGMGVLEDSSHSIAEFIHNTTALDWNSLRRFLQDRYA